MSSVPRRERDRKPFEYRTEVDRTSQEMPRKDTPIITKSAYQEKHGWVSPFPQGHSDHTPAVSKDEQTANMKRRG
jgi:hypothetical protein